MLKQTQDFILLQEYPTMLMGKLPLRLYYIERKYGDNPNNPEIQKEWYFGFPKEILPEGIRTLLGTSLYWDVATWYEQDSFILFRAGILGEPNGDLYKQLNNRLNFKMKMYNLCLNTLKKMAGKSSPSA